MRLHARRLAVLGPAAAVALAAHCFAPDTALALGLSVPSAATFSSNLGTTGTVDTTGGSVGVTALGSWVLRVSGSDGGRLRATGSGLCAQGTTLLANPLKMFATGSGVNNRGYTSASPLTLSGSPQIVASGNTGLISLLINVSFTYRYTASPNDQLPAGCPYSQTTTVDLSAS
jgi:hypothetical protein